MKVKSGSEVAQSCLTPSDPMDCSLPDSSTHGIFQARVLEWGATAFSDIYKTEIKKSSIFRKKRYTYISVEILKMFNKTGKDMEQLELSNLAVYV